MMHSEVRTTQSMPPFIDLPVPAVRLFVGGHASRVQGEPQNLAGDRMFTAAHPPQTGPFAAGALIVGVLDSGAFTDPPSKRLNRAGALRRQLAWEIKASAMWGIPFQAVGFVSYDRLIDEKWVAGERRKQRWSVAEGDRAVAETIAAAQYFARVRGRIAPRTLILSCQGVDAYQYQECVSEVLKVAQSHDWIGLGGWCILGRERRWMPTFWQTMQLVLPQIRRAGITHIHIFGVLYLPAIGGLSWLADQYGLTVSTDSTAPILNCTWKNKKKSGARCHYWRDNVAWWIRTLATLRDTTYYKAPPHLPAARQETFL